MIFLEAIEEPKSVEIAGTKIPVRTTYYVPKDSKYPALFKIIKAMYSFKKGRKINVKAGQDHAFIFTVEYVISNDEINL